MSVQSDRTDPAPSAGGDRPSPVVVGVDGSPGSRAALVHAFAAAARRGADLLVVATYSLEAVWAGGYPLGMPAVATVRDGTETRVQALVDDVRDDPAVQAVPGATDVPTSLVVSVGAAAHVLADASDGAGLLVVGSRGRGAVKSVLLGSVALHCVTHAHCPVVVVHQAAAGSPREHTVIVGLDGSAASRAALAVGLEEAERLGTDLAAVAAFEMVDHWVDLSSVVVPSDQEVEWQVRRTTEDHLEAALADHRARHDGRAPAARVVVVEGPAVDVLLRWGADAELLVVGSRGHGQFRGLLVGSVALACAMHGAGPVMVVPPAHAAVPVARPATAGG